MSPFNPPPPPQPAVAYGPPVSPTASYSVAEHPDFNRPITPVQYLTTVPSSTAGFGLPPPPPPPPGERFGKVFTPNEDGEYDPEQLDMMERLLAMYRPQYVPPQFTQQLLNQIEPPSPVMFSYQPPMGSTASVQVLPSGYGYPISPSLPAARPFPAPLPPPPPLSGRIMMEETPEE